MSATVYFYRVMPIQEKFDDVIDLDQGFDHEYVSIERARDWEIKVGQLVRLKYRTVDLFGISEKLFKQRAMSIQYLYSGYLFKDANGHSIGRINRDDLEPYYYIKEYDGYVYDQRLISEIDSFYFLDLFEGILTPEIVLNWLKTCIALENEHCVNDAVMALVKVYLDLLEHPDGLIVCDID